MEPRIQYATTADGLSIACWTLGTGPPLVHLPSFPFSHLQLEWQLPEYRRWYEGLAAGRRLVRYDCRGAGLSERVVADWSLDAFLLDLEAVTARLGLATFDLFAGLNGGPVAIAYAARHPEQVAHLVLWCTFSRAADFLGSPPAQAALGLMRADWASYTEMVAHAMVGWAEGEVAHRAAAYLRECVAPETAVRATEAIEAFDVTALLPEVRSPTLVLHRRQFPSPDLAAARLLASRIPDGRLTVLEGTSLAPLGEDMAAVLRAIDSFLGGEEVAPGPAPSGGELVTILFTDVAGSTALTQRLGDVRARELLRAHERLVRHALVAHGGTEVKTMGDGFMASFRSPSRALECAVAVQRAIAAHNASAPEAIRVRVGLNAGEPIAENADLFGTAVQLAARLCAHAEPECILVSNVVRELAAGRGFRFVDRGTAALHGFADPVHLYEVPWQ